MTETFTDAEIRSAMRAFLEFGEGSFGKAHQGYFSGEGWAARCLRYALQAPRAEPEARFPATREDLIREELRLESRLREIRREMIRAKTPEERLAEIREAFEGCDDCNETVFLLSLYDAAVNRPPAPAGYIDIVFDGPPSHESGRFVEVENEQKAGIRVGEWIEDPPFWRLRIPMSAPAGAVEIPERYTDRSKPCPTCHRYSASESEVVDRNRG